MRKGVTLASVCINKGRRYSLITLGLSRSLDVSLLLEPVANSVVIPSLVGIVTERIVVILKKLDESTRMKNQSADEPVTSLILTVSIGERTHSFRDF